MRPDDILLLDILLAAREALDFLLEVPLEEFERDRMRQLAVIKSVEIIGEAANRTSETFRELHPELPWRDIIAMRHRSTVTSKLISNDSGGRSVRIYLS